MKIHMRLLRTLFGRIHEDLSRSHRFASERVGFLSCKPASLADGGLLLIATTWHPVADDDYIDDRRVGARIGPEAFRKILQLAYREPQSILHVHRHEHSGPPAFSITDRRSMAEFVPSFFNVRRNLPHGGLVLSRDSVQGKIWCDPGAIGHEFRTVELVGMPNTTRDA